MTHPMTTDRLFAMLNKLGYKTKTVEHDPAFTVADNQAVRENIEGGHTKNLFVKDKKSNYFLLVVEESTQLSLNQLHKKIGGRGRLSFGSADKLQSYLGVKPGSVTAFAVVNDRENRVKVIMDENLLKYQHINCHPLVNTMTTTIARQDLLDFLEQCQHTPEILPLEDQNSNDSNA